MGEHKHKGNRMYQNSAGSRTQCLKTASCFQSICRSWCVYSFVGLCIFPGICSTIVCRLRQCESEEYEFRECKVSEDKFIINVTVKFLISDSNCTLLGNTRVEYSDSFGAYGFYGSTLWVDNGCRAYFYFCLADGTHTPTPPSSTETYYNPTSTSVSQSTLTTKSGYSASTFSTTSTSDALTSTTAPLNENMTYTQSTMLSSSEDTSSSPSSPTSPSTEEMSSSSTEIMDTATSSSVLMTTSSGAGNGSSTDKQSQPSETFAFFILGPLAGLVAIVLIGGVLGRYIWNKRYRHRKCPVEHESSSQEWKTRNIVDYINQIPNKPPSLADDGNWSLQPKPCKNNTNEPDTTKTAQNNITFERETNLNNLRPLPKPNSPDENQKYLNPLPTPCLPGQSRNNDTGLTEHSDEYLTPLTMKDKVGDDAMYTEIIETEETGLKHV